MRRKVKQMTIDARDVVGSGSALGKMPDATPVPDEVSYFYIKNVKGWMECPVCGEKMRFEEASESWVCENSDFCLPEAEFLDGYVFWFCDQCGQFLNAQEGFSEETGTWACASCGFENDLSAESFVGMCRECGALLENPDASLCPDCDKAWAESHAERNG